MKRSIQRLILLIVAGTFLIGCSNDDSENIGLNPVGVWVGTSVSYTGTTITEISGTNITATFAGEGYDIDYTFTITENPNEAISNGSYSIELTTTANGQTVVTNIENVVFGVTGSWSVSGSEMIVNVNGQSSSATIVELTENSMILNIKNETSFSNDGASITSTVDSFFEFTK